jgi:hypothetical protein
VDEYTLSQALGDKLGEVMEEHYKTFIVGLILDISRFKLGPGGSRVGEEIVKDV